ncbi:unnamed protein product [Amoebophrya sp. A25]|nr:unnamed protein product [Amoebophrya sp. A25]|eukprot:GSA25T00001478001.1
MARPVETLWVYLIDFAHAFEIPKTSSATATRTSLLPRSTSNRGPNTSTPVPSRGQYKHSATSTLQHQQGNLNPSEDYTDSGRDEGYIYGLKRLLHYVGHMRKRVERNQFGKLAVQSKKTNNL